MINRIILLFVFVFFPFSLLYSCEPCHTHLSLKETIQKADIIIVGQKEADGPMADLGHPDWIQIKVSKVLKGSLSTGSSIKVNSYNAMCAYGIIIDDTNNYLLLLEKASEYMKSCDYDAVQGGCSQSQFQINDGKINIQGRQILPDDIIKEIGE